MSLYPASLQLNPSLVLGIETSSAQGSLCLYSETKILGTRKWLREKPHSEWITLQLQELFSESKKSLSDISLISLGIGPGSFTGLRVGINLARTLGYSFNIPILPIDSLSLLALNSPDRKYPVVCMINAFKNLVYFTKYESAEELDSPKAIPFEELESLITQPCLCLGDALEIYGKSFSTKLSKNLIVSSQVSNYPDARLLEQWRATHKDSLQLIHWRELKPLYIRKSAPEEKIQSQYPQ